MSATLTPCFMPSPVSHYPRTGGASCAVDCCCSRHIAGENCGRTAYAVLWAGSRRHLYARTLMLGNKNHCANLPLLLIEVVFGTMLRNVQLLDSRHRSWQEFWNELNGLGQGWYEVVSIPCSTHSLNLLYQNGTMNATSSSFFFILRIRG